MNTVFAKDETSTDLLKTPRADSDTAPFVRDLGELSRADVKLVGGKAANLGEMRKARLPVPQGFVVTTDAYRAFLKVNHLPAAIAYRMRMLDVDDSAQLAAVSADLQDLVRRSPIPRTVEDAILAAYQQIGHSRARFHEYVAVRSSATVEDCERMSFAGMFESYLNISGEESLLEAVRNCWASQFSSRLLFYSARQNLAEGALVGVVVQRMVNSDKAGVMFTVDPTGTGNESLLIEAAFGLGEVGVSGVVNPDRYVVEKATRCVVSSAVGSKSFMLTRDEVARSTKRIALENDKANAPVLTASELNTLVDLGIRAEQYYGSAQDVEWAIEGAEAYLVQARPITTLLSRPAANAQGTQARARVLVRGLGASPGSATGLVRVTSPKDAALVLKGDIIVTTITTPDWVPVMRRAAAIVTDVGGMTSHAAIVSRELGIPGVVGTGNATAVLKTGQIVTVSATDGLVLEGTTPAQTPAAAASTSHAPPRAGPVTGTRVYVNLGEPDRAAEVAAMDVDGIGLLRAEFMIVEALENRHPRRMLQDGHGEEFVARMAARLKVFGAAFGSRPVIYRAVDFRSNEFRNLEGAEEFEPVEANPMMGYRGCFRYTKEPDLFALELRALSEARREYPNLHLMLPFVRTLREFAECKQLIDASGLLANGGMQLWVMAEVPSVICWLPEYVKMGVTGVSIRSNDLTQLILGIDRDSERLAPIFDERDGAVLAAIRSIIEESHRLGITCSICGQAPSVHSDYADRLVEWGIDSVSVNPDVVDATRSRVASAEQRLLLRAARTK
jgi:pyruvate,water dikinase